MLKAKVCVSSRSNRYAPNRRNPNSV